MTDPNTDAAVDPNLSPRLAEFAAKAEAIGVSGGLAQPEHRRARLGRLLMLAGLLTAVFAMIYRRGDIYGDEGLELLSQVVRSGNGIVFVGVGIVIAIIGGIVFLRNSLTSYFRYWLIRLIFEDRANTDRIIAAIKAESDPESANSPPDLSGDGDNDGDSDGDSG